MEEKEIKKLDIEKSQEKKKTHKIARTIGAASVVIGSAAVASKVVPTLAGAINKASVKYSNRKSDEDDWGPEMIKKIEYKGSEGDEDAD